tara:strand:- start:124 stop:420 length:297 start_codon:yes stop_codon:yes gene_type:complete
MNDFCPLIQKKCKEHKCKFFIQIQGKNPNTGEDISQFDCAVTWLPMLLIEGSQQTRQSGAAIESFRNEMVRLNESSLNLLSHHKTLENEENYGTVGKK